MGLLDPLQLNGAVLATTLALSSLIVVVVVVIVVVAVIVAAPLIAFSGRSGAGLAAHSECCSRQTVGKVDLSADGVCEVGDEENILDVIIAGFFC